MSWPWSELGLSGPAALPEIRSAYAQRLKATHPEEDPEGFQRLHTAYQEAAGGPRRSPGPPQRPPSPLPRRAPKSSPESRNPKTRSGTMRNS